MYIFHVDIFRTSLSYIIITGQDKVAESSQVEVVEDFRAFFFAFLTFFVGPGAGELWLGPMSLDATSRLGGSVGNSESASSKPLFLPRCDLDFVTGTLGADVSLGGDAVSVELLNFGGVG